MKTTYENPPTPDLLALLQAYSDRFYGGRPMDKQILNFINDYYKEN